MLLRFRKPVSVVLAAAMALAMCSCASEEAGQDGNTSGSYHFHWMDSNLLENVDKMGKANLKDDYAAAVNYEWTKKQTGDTSYMISSFGEAQRKVVENKRAILNDKSVTGDKNVELVRIADGLFNDWEYRNSIGVEPLKKYLGYIDQIKTLDDVTAYMTDNDKNPFAFSLVKMSYTGNEALSNCRALCLEKPDLMLEEASRYVVLSDEAYKIKEKKEKQISYLLARCGYQDKDIKSVIGRGFRLESELVHLDYAVLMDFKKVETMDEILKKAGSYPLGKFLSHYGITKCDHIMGELSYIDRLENIYKQSNVEDMKAYFRARLALESIRYLDREAYDFYMDTNLDRTNQFAQRIDRDPDLIFFLMLNKTALTAAVDQMYIDYFFDEGTYNEIKYFVKQLKAKYEILIGENKILSDEAKKAVREKLDKMGENVIRPTNRADFTGVTLKSKEEGGTFLDAFCTLNRISNEHTGVIVQQEIPRDYWDIYDGSLSTTVTNATYDSMQNCIYIRGGILVEPIYMPDAPIEKKLGSFVSVVGHEISHAFDSKNISQDAEGRESGVITKEELDQWSNTASRIGSHFMGYKAFEGAPEYDGGTMISSEVIADAEGVKAALMIAKDYENFDYDMFFRSYADFWKFVMTKQEQLDLINKNPHPLEYLRINYTLAQFDEFIETYGIKPGDGMYMDPSERILIW